MMRMRIGKWHSVWSREIHESTARRTVDDIANNEVLLMRQQDEFLGEGGHRPVSGLSDISISRIYACSASEEILRLIWFLHQRWNIKTDICATNRFIVWIETDDASMIAVVAVALPALTLWRCASFIALCMDSVQLLNRNSLWVKEWTLHFCFDVVGRTSKNYDLLYSEEKDRCS